MPGKSACPFLLSLPSSPRLPAQSLLQALVNSFPGHIPPPFLFGEQVLQQRKPSMRNSNHMYCRLLARPGRGQVCGLTYFSLAVRIASWSSFTCMMRTATSPTAPCAARAASCFCAATQAAVGECRSVGLDERALDPRLYPTVPAACRQLKTNNIPWDLLTSMDCSDA